MFELWDEFIDHLPLPPPHLTPHIGPHGDGGDIVLWCGWWGWIIHLIHHHPYPQPSISHLISNITPIITIQHHITTIKFFSSFFQRYCDSRYTGYVRWNMRWVIQFWCSHHPRAASLGEEDFETLENGSNLPISTSISRWLSISVVKGPIRRGGGGVDAGQRRRREISQKQNHPQVDQHDHGYGEKRMRWACLMKGWFEGVWCEG